MHRIKAEHEGEDLSPQKLQQYFNDYKAKILRFSPLEFTIEREDYQEGKEKLRITEIVNSNQESIPVNDFQLSVQSLNDPDCYWLDSGSFEINIKA